MSRFPTELAKDPPEPWWQTTSLAELDNAPVLIDHFTRESKEPSSLSREEFARAIALQMLCVDVGILDEVIDRVDERSERYRPELRPDGDSEKLDAFGSWLSRAEDVAKGLVRCAELLPQALRAEKAPQLLDFLRRTEDHIDAHIEFLFGRREVPFTLRKRPSRPKPE